MRRFKNIQSHPEKLAELDAQGWLNPRFFCLLTAAESRRLLGSPEDPDNDKKIMALQEKDRKTLGLLPTQAEISSIGLRTPKWRVSTGSHQLDILFAPPPLSSAEMSHFPVGIPAGELVLFFGRARAGKTQICFHTIVSLFSSAADLDLPAPPHVIYIDTEGTFRPDRIAQIADGYGIPFAFILSHITVVTIQNYNEQLIIFEKLAEMLRVHPIALIIIDSLTHHFRVELARKEIPAYILENDLTQQLISLKKLARENVIPILCTSQVMDVDPKLVRVDVLPIFSYILNSTIKTWILLDAPEDPAGVRTAYVMNSEIHPETKIRFQITSGGIRDIDPPSDAPSNEKTIIH